MGKNNLSGAWGEAVAAEYMRKKHFQLVAAGYRSRFGEIDLIMKDRKYLVFVEVKYRTDGHCGNPGEAIDFKKQKKIYRVAEYYLYNSRLPQDIAVLMRL